MASDPEWSFIGLLCLIDGGEQRLLGHLKRI
jgi:hypothetical protein